MKRNYILTIVISAFALTAAANAQTGSGTLGVTATIEGSLNLTFSTDASGLAMTGTGTSAASLPLGTVSMYGGTLPANVTRTVTGATSFSLATPFDVRVDLANSISTAYTLNASLSAADATNKWLIGATDISAGGPFALTRSEEHTSELQSLRH